MGIFYTEFFYSIPIPSQSFLLYQLSKGYVNLWIQIEEIHI